MFCPNCGAQVEDGTAFCSNCGAKIEAAQPQNVVQPESQALTDQEAREEASYTINMIQKYNITYPVVFDWETAPGYRTYDIPLASWQMNDMATTFCDMVASYGYIPMMVLFHSSAR